MITLVTHGDTGCVGANLDPAAITQPALFTQCLADGFSEVLAYTPAPPHPQSAPEEYPLKHGFRGA